MGGTRPEYVVDIWSGNHPVFLGQADAVMVTDEGQVNKFNAKFGDLSGSIGKVTTINSAKEETKVRDQMNGRETSASPIPSSCYPMHQPHPNAGGSCAHDLVSPKSFLYKVNYLCVVTFSPLGCAPSLYQEE